MRVGILLLAVSCWLSAVFAGLSGTYTIKPDSTGDFSDFQDVANALEDSGMSGDCIFEVYGDTQYVGVDLLEAPGSDTWTTTFRPGPGQRPVLAYGSIHCCMSNVKFEDFGLFRLFLDLQYCRGLRISGCRLTVFESGIMLQDGAFDTIVGNEIVALTAHPAVCLVDGHDNVFANNMVTGDLWMYADFWGLVELNNERAPRVYYNTLRYVAATNEINTALMMDDCAQADVRNNVLVLAMPSDTTNACLGFWPGGGETLSADYNCYHIESLGRVALCPDYLSRLGWTEWQALGYDANGLYADPLIVGPYDLHLRPGSPCIGAGVPIPGFEYDIDGDLRDPTHPCIGADEFTGGGVEEAMSDECGMMNGGPTILSGANVRSLESKVIFDAMGRRVLSPKSGIVFIRERSAVGGERSAVRVRKVILQR